MSDWRVPASLTSFAVTPRATCRFYATVRTEGAALPTPEVWRALTLAGFGSDLQLWPSGQPSDWPVEDVPPLRAGQVVLRGQGTYGGNSLPTVVHLPSGPTLQIWNVWEHSEAATGELLGESRGAAPLGLLLLGLLGLAVGAPRARGRRSQA